MKFYKDIEKQIIEECDKYKINCIDTSENRQKIFEKLIQDIRKEIQ